MDKLKHEEIPGITIKDLDGVPDYLVVVDGAVFVG